MQSMKSTRLHETSCPVKRPESQIEPQSSKYRLYNVIDRFLSSFFSTRFTTERHRTPSNMAPGREFFCNCAEFCMRGGSTEPKSVSKSTYHRSESHHPYAPISRPARHCDPLPSGSLSCNRLFPLISHPLESFLILIGSLAFNAGHVLNV